jgi:TolB-like protein/Tfp pilus assembly protein PilF
MPSGDVFISYASQDKAMADAICGALERAGVACWIAPRDVMPGVFYADAIVGGINGTRVLVLVLTASAITSPHVLREVERASAKRHPVVSFRIDSAPLPPGLEYFLSASHWLDATISGVDSAMLKLIEAVQRLVAPASAQEPGHQVATAKPIVDVFPRPPAGQQTSQRMTRPVIVLSAVIVLGLAYFAMEKLWLAPRKLGARPVVAVAPVATPTAPAIPEKSIAVLPFVDMSEKKDQEYFADGMAEEILDVLAKIHGLIVIGRTSSFQFKGRNDDLRMIGTKLNAAYVLEGSVRRSGDQVRITAQLINTRAGTHEWSATYDRRMGDVIKLQGEIAAAVARELELTVASGNLESRATLKSADAYDLLLRGRHAADRWDRDSLEEAVTLFKQALDLDSTSAEAAAALAFAYEQQGEEGFAARSEAFEQARRAAEMALRLNPRSALAHCVMGLVLGHYDWNWVAAEREIQQAAQLAPGSVDARNAQAELAAALGRWDEAFRHVTAALTIDPLDPDSLSILGEIQLRRGHFQEAEAAWLRALDIRPTFAWAHYYLGLTKLARGDPAAALLAMQHGTTDEGRLLGMTMAYHALGRKADSDAALARLRNEHADDDAFNIACAYAFRHQSDDALLWLERAYAQRDPDLYYLKLEIALKNLDGDTRYKAFLRKMNLPE